MSADAPMPEFDPSADRIAAEADTTSWLSRRGAVLAAAVSLGLLVIAVVVCLIVWLTPATVALDIPSVPRG